MIISGLPSMLNVYKTAFYRLLFAVILFFIAFEAGAQDVIEINKSSSAALQSHLAYFLDSTGSLQVNDIDRLNLDWNPEKTIVYSSGVKNVWLKFGVKNTSDAPVFFDLRYTNLSLVSIYKVDSSGIHVLDSAGNDVPSHPVITGSPNIIFNLKLGKNQAASYYVNIKSVHPIIIPIYIISQEPLIASASIQTIILGLYLGLLGVMFFYNLFLLISTRDNNYLYYIIYIFFLAFAQITAAGYGFTYLWPQSTYLNKYSVVFATSLSTVSATFFTIFFLQTAFYTPRVHKFLLAFIGIYLVGIICNFLGFYAVSYSILNLNSLASGITVLTASTYIAIRGFRSAYFYLIAWSALIISLIVLVLRNLNVLPYNNFTAYIIYIGSGIEITLLSVALADKINILSKETAMSQAQALQASQENEKLIREQNVELEKRVAERTEELQSTNHQLNHTLNDLKDAQTQLVEAEKMASLGQLTAGIAHEINNPINFVKSNIKPLQLDINDIFEVIDKYNDLHDLKEEKLTGYLKEIDELKEELDIDFVKNEIQSLIKGIEEGADRTAEIVRGLRTFSRLDEGELKKVSVHDGLDSTLVLLKNSTPHYVKIIRNYQADGNIECFPGKLNQVFMNIINNGIQAITGKKEQAETESITISTRDVEDEHIEISIKDSGMGMTEEVKHKVFEPFFTTKDVGEGTGLGMAIVFKIIQQHHGKINILSTPGNGAEFILTLPYTQPS